MHSDTPFGKTRKNTALHYELAFALLLEFQKFFLGSRGSTSLHELISTEQGLDWVDFGNHSKHSRVSVSLEALELTFIILKIQNSFLIGYA